MTSVSQGLHPSWESSQDRPKINLIEGQSHQQKLHTSPSPSYIHILWSHWLGPQHPLGPSCAQVAGLVLLVGGGGWQLGAPGHGAMTRPRINLAADPSTTLHTHCRPGSTWQTHGMAGVSGRASRKTGADTSLPAQ